MEFQEETEKKTKKAPHYKKIVDAFIKYSYDEHSEWFRYWRGQILQYNKDRYIIQDEIGNKIRRFLMAQEVSFNNSTISNVVSTLQATVECQQEKYPEMPFWTKNVPIIPKNVMAFRNGLLDVEKAVAGKFDLIPHTPNWVSRICLPHDYRPDEGCPRWLSFLEDTLDGDSSRIDLLQEFFGYCLTSDNSYQKMLVLLGVSRGGKGTTVKVLEALLGTENITGYNLQALAGRFGLGGLVGKLVATIGEVNLAGNRDRYTIFQTLNAITGDDPVEIEWKHNPIKMSVRLPIRFVVSCNAMPHFADDSGALAERLLIVNFEKAVPPDKRDPDLAEKLVTEISGITNWALRGLARLRTNRRFTTPAIMDETVNDLRRKSSNALAFAQDRLLVHRCLDTGNLPGVEITDKPFEDCWVMAEKANLEFKHWLGEHQIEANATWLFSNLKTIIPKLKRSRLATADILGVRPWTFKGIMLKA